MSGNGDTVSAEVASAVLESTVEWATLAEKLMFELEKTGLIGMDPELGREYQEACTDEPFKYESKFCKKAPGDTNEQAGKS